MISNLVVAATESRVYSKAIASMHTLVELRKSDDENHGVDVDCLELLVNAVVASVAEQAVAAATSSAASSAGVAATTPASDVKDAEPAVTFDGDDVETGGATAVPESTGFVHVDNQGVPASAYLEQTAKLMGHITSAISRNARVWRLYARLQQARNRKADVLDCYLREVRPVPAAPQPQFCARVGCGAIPGS